MRSVHAYDIIPTIDYASVSRENIIHAYDVQAAYNYAYASRQNVIHAYDVITQTDIATKSGKVAISVTDILVFPEWFFRVNKALRIFELYRLFELATVSTVPTIYAVDFATVYDLGSLNTKKAVSAFDGLIVDGISYNIVKVVSVLDKLVSDSVTTSRSYSSLFFSLFRRKIPIRYMTLSVLDTVAVVDGASAVKIKQVYANDYFAPADSGVAKGVVSVLVRDYSILSDSYGAKNLAIHAYDVIPVADYGMAIKAKVVEAKDYISTADYLDTKKAAIITAFDGVLIDSTSISKSYSSLFFSLFRRRIPISYRTLSVLDSIAVSESISPVLAKMVTVLDKLVSDSITTSKSYLPLFFSLFRMRIPIRYLRLSIADTQAVADSASVVKIKIVSVSDYVIYDYVPSMNPNDILFMSMYSNSAISGISATDIYAFYERVDIVNRSVVASDSVAIFESISVVKR